MKQTFTRNWAVWPDLVLSSHPHVNIHQGVQGNIIAGKNGNFRYSEAPLEVNREEGKAVVCLGAAQGVCRACQAVKNCCSRKVSSVFTGELCFPRQRAVGRGPAPPHDGTVWQCGRCRYWRLTPGSVRSCLFFPKFPIRVRDLVAWITERWSLAEMLT